MISNPKIQTLMLLSELIHFISYQFNTPVSQMKNLKT